MRIRALPRASVSARGRSSMVVKSSFPSIFALQAMITLIFSSTNLVGQVIETERPTRTIQVRDPVRGQVQSRPGDVQSFFAEVSVNLLANQLSPGQSLGNPTRDSRDFAFHHSWARNVDVNRLKVDLIEKLNQLVDLKVREGAEAKSDWYALLCSTWAGYGIDFGSPGANNTDPAVHKRWAWGQPASVLKNEISMRLDKIFAAYSEQVSVLPLPIPYPRPEDIPSFFSEVSVNLLANQLSPGQSLGSATRDSRDFASHHSWARNVGVDRLKLDLIEKLDQMVDLKVREGAEAKSDWYALLCSTWAGYGIDFGSPGANNTDPAVHKRWAWGQPASVLKNEISMRLDKILAAYMLPDLIVAEVVAGIPSFEENGKVANLPLRITLKNLGGATSRDFKTSVDVVVGSGGRYLRPFSVSGQTDIWYPWQRGLGAGEEATFSGNLIISVPGIDVLYNQEAQIMVFVDSCSGDEFMPEYCRVQERNEVNNAREVSVRLARMQLEPLQAFPIQPLDMSGAWNSNVGLIYEVEQKWEMVRWGFPGEVLHNASGTIEGKTVSVRWHDPVAERSGLVRGEIILDNQGQIIRIEWSNGVFFHRDGPSAGEPQEVLQISPSDEAMKEFRSRGLDSAMEVARLDPEHFLSSYSQEVRIDGHWSTNINLPYHIKQTGNRFTWAIAGIDQVGQGIINGLDVQVNWKEGQVPVSATGRIFIDTHGRGYRIEMSNGVVFSRQLPPIDAYSAA